MALSVFPERMNELDTENPEKALGTVENYIHYMCERVEFSLSNFFRTIGSYGTSSAEHALLLAAHDNAIHAMDSQITALTGQTEALGRQVSGLEDTVEELEDRVSALEDLITAAGPILITNAADVTAAVGEDAVFSVRAIGSNLTYKWEMLYGSDWIYPNFAGRDTAQMTVPATSGRNGYRFRCTITGGGWTVVSRTVTLTVTS